jgi:tetratricopeptide (TPR) repeat protein
MRRIAAILLILFALPVASFAQECKVDLEKGKALFGRFNEGEATFKMAKESYLAAAHDPSCAYEAYWRLADLNLCFGTAAKVSSKLKKNYFERGLIWAEKAIEANPAGPEGHFQKAVNLGSIVEVDGVMKNLGKVRTLKKSNDKALSLDPNFAPALVVRARMNADLPSIFGGSDAQAEADFKKAIASLPNYETSYVEYAGFLVGKKRYTEAEALLEKLTAPGFSHQFSAPWIAIDKPKAEALLKKVKATEGP